MLAFLCGDRLAVAQDTKFQKIVLLKPEHWAGSIARWSRRAAEGTRQSRRANMMLDPT